MNHESDGHAPKLSLDNWDEVNASISHFIDSMNQGKLNNLVKQYSKSVTQLEKGSFILDSSRKNFFQDGEFIISMGFQDIKDDFPLWLCTMSFSRLNRLAFYSDTLDRTIPSYSHPFPVIVQLQGPALHIYPLDQDRQQIRTLADQINDYEQALSIIKTFRWEHTLVSLLINWAISEQIPDLYLLPASINKWTDQPFTPNKLLEERLKIRYDVTAQRMGFKMQPNGLYGISLAYLLVEDDHRLG